MMHLMRLDSLSVCVVVAFLVSMSMSMSLLIEARLSSGVWMTQDCRSEMAESRASLSCSPRRQGSDVSAFAHS